MYELLFQPISPKKDIERPPYVEASRPTSPQDQLQYQFYQRSLKPEPSIEDLERYAIFVFL